MWFNLVFLTVIFWVSGFTVSDVNINEIVIQSLFKTAQSFPVATTKIFNFANPDDSERLFYTKLSEISVFEDYGSNFNIIMIFNFPGFWFQNPPTIPFQKT